MAKKARVRKPARTPEQRHQDEITCTQDMYYLSMRGYCQDFKYVDIPAAVEDFLRDAPLNELQTVMVDLLPAIRDRTPPEEPARKKLPREQTPRRTPRARKKPPGKKPGVKRPRAKKASGKGRS